MDNEREPALPRVATVVGVYVAAGFAWIVLSAPLADYLADATTIPRATLEVSKGLMFVGVTALALYVSMRHWADQLHAAAEREREAVRELRNAQDLRTAFLQGVSHELRTPLTSILGYSQTIHSRCRDLPFEMLEKIADRLMINARHLERLVLDLLDVDRMARGLDDVNRTPVDVPELVRTVVANVHAPEHAMRVSGAEELVASIDGPKVERIVEHLVHKAVRQTPDGTQILVRVTPREAGGASITVEDDGPGLPDEVRQDLGRPFVQGSDAAADASPGLGIGLALVRRHARIHGGEVRIEEPDFGGARVVVDLPDRPVGVTRADDSYYTPRG